MTQKERLANLLDGFWKEHYDACNTDAMTEHLLSNGVIVPPCKVGDTVYCAALRSIAPFIKQEIVERIQYTEQGFYYGMQKGIYFEDEVFLSKEEAERALKERETK